MPIGKNALKRVSNNGYSNVNTSAPDMEHSVVAEPEIKEAPKAEAKKPAAKSAPKEVKQTAKVAKSAPKTKTEKKAVQKKETDTRPDGFLRYELGDDMPVHLL